MRLSETLVGLVDAVLGEFTKENPFITKMYIKWENTGSYHRNFAAFKFSIKSVNPKVQRLCVMITMSPIVGKISVTGKVLLWKILFEILLMLDITCSGLVTFFMVCSLQIGWKIPKWVFLKLISTCQS